MSTPAAAGPDRVTVIGSNDDICPGCDTTTKVHSVPAPPQVQAWTCTACDARWATTQVHLTVLPERCRPSSPPDPGWPLVERRIPPISSQRLAGPHHHHIVMGKPGPATSEVSAFVCASVVHLISAHEVDQSSGRTLVAVCGELVADASCAPA